MEQVQLDAELREKKQKEFCKKLRKEGGLPAVVYGLKKEATHLTLNYKEFYSLRMKTKDESSFLNLSISGGDALIEKPVIVKDIQVHPVSGNAVHVDFLEISMQEKAIFDVHIVFTNEEIPLKKSDGVLEHHMRSLHVKALPADVPDHIELDLSEIEIGHSIHIKDILGIAGEKVEIHEDESKVVVALTARTKARIEEEEAEEETSEESESEE